MGAQIDSKSDPAKLLLESFIKTENRQYQFSLKGKKIVKLETIGVRQTSYVGRVIDWMLRPLLLTKDQYAGIRKAKVAFVEAITSEYGSEIRIKVCRGLDVSNSSPLTGYRAKLIVDNANTLLFEKEIQRIEQKNRSVEKWNESQTGNIIEKKVEGTDLKSKKQRKSILRKRPSTDLNTQFDEVIRTGINNLRKLGSIDERDIALFKKIVGHDKEAFVRNSEGIEGYVEDQFQLYCRIGNRLAQDERFDGKAAQEFCLEVLMQALGKMQARYQYLESRTSFFVSEKISTRGRAFKRYSREQEPLRRMLVLTEKLALDVLYQNLSAMNQEVLQKVVCTSNRHGDSELKRVFDEICRVVSRGAVESWVNWDAEEHKGVNAELRTLVEKKIGHVPPLQQYLNMERILEVLRQESLISIRENWETLIESPSKRKKFMEACVDQFFDDLLSKKPVLDTLRDSFVSGMEGDSVEQVPLRKEVGERLVQELDANAVAFFKAWMRNRHFVGDRRRVIRCLLEDEKAGGNVLEEGRLRERIQSKLDGLEPKRLRRLLLNPAIRVRFAEHVKHRVLVIASQNGNREKLPQDLWNIQMVDRGIDAMIKMYRENKTIAH